MNGKNIFVTGAAGFIGARLSEMLLDLGYNVTGIDKMYSKNYYRQLHHIMQVADRKSVV